MICAMSFQQPRPESVNLQLLVDSIPTLTPLPMASASILIAAASNNVVKGIYAYAMADRKTGIQSLCLLIGLAALGVTRLLWLPA
jgi:hypothetical protein